MDWNCGECGTPVWVRQGPKSMWYQCPKCGTRVYLGKDLKLPDEKVEPK